MQPAAETPVEDFESLFHGHPKDIEQRLIALRPKAADHPDLTLAPRIEARIALTQAMQGRHDEASRTLCLAEAMPGATQPAAAICLLMEQARLLHQAEKATDACPLFIRAFHFARQHSMDGLAVDAAHMVAITAAEPDAQVRWNETALDLARNSADPKATAWISVLHNNLAQAFIADSQFTAALNAFNSCRELALAENNSIVERGARWGIARALRSLGQTTEALAMQQQVLSEYNQLEETGALPVELIRMGRGLVHEELAQLCSTEAPNHAAQALEDLKSCKWWRQAKYWDRWWSLVRLAEQLPDFNLEKFTQN
jgi:hypothetical protein